MKIIVCGGRDFADRHRLFDALDEVHHQTRITCVITGACCDRDGRRVGADLAEEWAVWAEVPYRGYPARWSQEGDAAGPRRNERMLRLEHAPPTRTVGLCVAFRGGVGTADMVRRCRAAGIEVRTP